MSELEATDLGAEDEFDEPTIVRESTDNVGDVSVELNVEELLHELEVDGLLSESDRPERTRRRLEEIMEQKRAARELEDFDDYDI